MSGAHSKSQPSAFLMLRFANHSELLSAAIAVFKSSSPLGSTCIEVDK